MYKKLLVSFIAVIMIISMTAFATEPYGKDNAPVDIDINGCFVKCEEKAIIVNASTYIPLRAFSDAVGGMVTWDNESKSATMTKDGHTFVFYPHEGYCVIDGVRSEYPSMIYANLTFIPVRAVSEVLGYEVEWDNLNFIVNISAPGIVVPAEYQDNSYTLEDLVYLGRIVQIESGYQHFEVKLGVANTVLNRAKSPEFPDTIKDVIYDSRYGVQFPPAHTEKFNNTPSRESMIAANCALNGVNNVGGSLYFIDTAYAASSWTHNNRPFYGAVHDMSFYE